MFTKITLTRYDVRLDTQTGHDVPISSFWNMTCHAEYTNHGTLAKIPIKNVVDLLRQLNPYEIVVPDRYAQEWLAKKGFMRVNLGR